MINHLSLLQSLAKDANYAIGRALRHGCTLAVGRVPPPRKEVDAILSVFLCALPVIAATWVPRLAKARYSVSFTGVFCHSSPQVLFTDSKGTRRPCELADLLIVIDDYGLASKPIWKDRRANLIQAKPAPIKIGTGLPERQLDLYMYWHAFEFTSAEYTQQTLNVGAKGTPPHVDDSGRYGGIYYTAGSWIQVVPSLAMNTATGIPLGTFMAEMALGVPHSGRFANETNTDDWSTTINELLRVTAGQTIGSTSRPWAHGQPKQIASSYFDTGLIPVDPRSTLQLIMRDPPTAGIERGPERSPEGGISVLHVSIARTDEDID